MKKVILIVSMILCYGISKAQTFVIQNDSAFGSGTMGDALADTQYFVIQAVNHLHNTSTDTIASSWVRTVQFLTSGWTTSCCDPVNCWGEGVDAENFLFPSNQNALVVVDFKPHGLPGLGVIRIKYFVQNMPTDSAEGVFVGQLDIDSDVPKVELVKDTKIYPVPSDKKIFVITPASVCASKIEVYNFIGQLQMSIQNPSTNNNLSAIDISGLNNGAYFIKIITNDHKSVVLKFTKS